MTTTLTRSATPTPVGNSLTAGQLPKWMPWVLLAGALAVPVVPRARGFADSRTALIVPRRARARRRAFLRRAGRGGGRATRASP